MLFTIGLRTPDFEIGQPGNPYMRRWWLIPRNERFNAYLHHVRRSDDDRALHDHPWANLSIVLKGGYWEHVPAIAGEPTGAVVRKWRGPGSIVFRRPRAAHRLEIDPEVGPAWTLFITGPKVRDWGFHCPRGWKHWREFTKPGRPGEVGPGCGD